MNDQLFRQWPEDELRKDLRDWFKEKWVDVSRKDKDGKHPPCGRDDADKSSRGYPKCRPSKKVSSKTPKTSGSMSAKDKKAATKRKRSKPQGVGGKPTMVKSVCECNTCQSLVKAVLIKAGPSLSVGRGEKQSVKSGGGLTAKGRAKYNRATGSKLKAPVTSKNPKGKDKARKKSFCARSRSWKGPRGKAARRRWNC